MRQTYSLTPGLLSLPSYRSILDRYVLPRLGDAALADLNGRRLTRLYQQLLRSGGREQRPLSIRTVRYVHATLHKALGDGVRDGLLTANPSDRATLPKLHPERADKLGADQEVNAWTAEELRAFLEATREHPRHPLWLVAAARGLRRGELLGLAWDADLDVYAHVLPAMDAEAFDRFAAHAWGVDMRNRACSVGSCSARR